MSVKVLTADEGQSTVSLNRKNAYHHWSGSVQQIEPFPAQAGGEVRSATVLTRGPVLDGKALVGAEEELEETEDFFTMLEGLFRDDSLALAGDALGVFVS